MRLELWSRVGRILQMGSARQRASNEVRAVSVGKHTQGSLQIGAVLRQRRSKPQVTVRQPQARQRRTV